MHGVEAADVRWHSKDTKQGMSEIWSKQTDSQTVEGREMRYYSKSKEENPSPGTKR